MRKYIKQKIMLLMSFLAPIIIVNMLLPGFILSEYMILAVLDQTSYEVFKYYYETLFIAILMGFYNMKNMNRLLKFKDEVNV